MKHALARAAAEAMIAAALAAGAVPLPRAQAQLAIAETSVKGHGKDTIRAIQARQNDETGKAFPSLERIGKDVSRTRRTAVDRVKELRELELERDGVIVVVIPCWHSEMRRAGEKVRSNHYWIGYRQDVAAKIGWRILPSPDPCDGPAPCDAPNTTPTPPPTPPAPPVLEAAPAPATAPSIETPAVPALEAAPAPATAPSIESKDVRLVREAMLRHPETADFAGDAPKWLGIGRRAKKKLQQILQAVADTADKSRPTESIAVRWDRGVSFLRAEDGRERSTEPRLSAEAKREADANEARDKAARRRADAETMRAMGVTPAAPPLATRAQRAARTEEDLQAKAREQREALAAFARQIGESEDKPP